MHLVVDASVLVAELVRSRGRALVSHAELDLVAPAEVFDETAYELRRRVALLERRAVLLPEDATGLLNAALLTLSTRVVLFPLDTYNDRLDAARRRIPRDPNDAPTVALALTLDRVIWTTDNDFLGCGLPVWTTETLLLYINHE